MGGRDRLGAAVVALLLIGTWEAGVRLGNVPPYVLPAPSAVLRSFVHDFPLLLHHAGATLGAFGVGLSLGVAAGVLLAGLSFYVRPVGRALAPFLVGSQMIPVFAVAPLLVLWFGYGILAKAAVAATISFFPIAVNALDGLRSVRPELLEFFQALGAGEGKLLRLVRLPAALPFLLSGLRVGGTLALVGATIGEWVGASRGLGYLMIRANAQLRTDLVFAAILLLTLLGLGFFGSVGLLERALPPRRSRLRTP